MRALLDNDSPAGALAVEPRTEGLVEPADSALAHKVAVGLRRVDKVVRDNLVVTLAG
jgi:hypothetical protein